MTSIARRTVLACATVGAAVSLAGAARATAPKIDQPAPPFRVFTFEWKHVNFADLKGQVILLNYWATWCAPCRKELPELSAYFRRHAGEGLQMFAVKDGDGRPNQDLIPLSKVVAFPLAWSLSGKGYGAIDNAYPSNFVIDRAGILRYAKAGAFDADSLDEVLGPLLAEKAPVAAATT